jgi:uncharacterized protein YukE
MQGRPDVNGMRHAASQFRLKADRANTVSRRLDSQLSAMAFAGPAANQFRNAVAWEQHRLREIARLLVQAADVLNTSANRVELDPLGFYGAQGGSSS